MAKLYDIMASVGSYEDANGQTKTRWLNCGAVIQTAAGKVAIKLDALPVAPVGGDGGLWLQCFEPNQDKKNLHTASAQGFRQNTQQPPQQNAPFVPQGIQGAQGGQFAGQQAGQQFVQQPFAQQPQQPMPQGQFQQPMQPAQPFPQNTGGAFKDSDIPW